MHLILALLLAQLDPLPEPPLAPAAPIVPAPPPDPIVATVETHPLRFGERGQVVTSVSVNLSGAYNANSVGNSSYNVSLAPGADYFVRDDFSIGGQIVGGVSGTRTVGSHTDTLSTSIAPRIGYNIPITNHLSVWPKLLVYLGYSAETTTIDTLPASGIPEPSGGVRTVTLATQLYIPFVIELAPHVLWGIGPYLVLGTQLYSYPTNAVIVANGGTAANGTTLSPTVISPATSNQYVTVGLGTEVGGFF